MPISKFISYDIGNLRYHIPDIAVLYLRYHRPSEATGTYDIVDFIRYRRTTTSGTPIFSICLVYAWYIPCICRSHQYTWNICGIFIDIHGYRMYIHSVDIHSISLDIPRISTKYIHGISMDIHGISLDVYTWYIRCISMHIPSFFYQISRPVRAAGLI